MTDFAPPPGQGYDLQRTYTENKTDFWFRWADRWWKLSNLQMLDFEVQLQAMSFQGRVAEDADTATLGSFVNELFDLVLEEGHEGQSADWRKVSRPLPALMNILSQWSEHSGADAGESEASAGSSESTGRPSKRTSNAGTASGSRKRSTVRGRAATPPANS